MDSTAEFGNRCASSDAFLWGEVRIERIRCCVSWGSASGFAIILDCDAFTVRSGAGGLVFQCRVGTFHRGCPFS